MPAQPPNSRLLILADLRYRLYGGEGGSVHLRAMTEAFSEFMEVCEPPCRVSLGLLSRGDAAGRSGRPGKLIERIGLGIGTLEKVAAYLHFRPALVYVRHELTEVPTLLLLKLLGARLALEVNALVADERAGTHSRGRVAVTRWLERLAFGASDQLFCVSDYLASRLVTSGVPPEKVAVTHNGIKPADFPDEAAHLSGDVRVIGFNGTNKPWHGLPVLVEAFAELAERRPNLELLIVGPSSPDLEERVRTLGLVDRVEVTGFLPHHEALLATRRFDLAVLPNCPPHNSPLKLFEYMGLAKPIIAARTPGIAEVMKDEETCLLIEPNSREALIGAIERLSGDAGLRERLGSRARRVVLERHTWRRNALAVLERVLPAKEGT